MRTWLVLLLGLSALGISASTAQADANIGPHLGVNFDVDDPFLGIESRIDVAQLASTVELQINPSFSYYFTDGVDLFNLSFNMPFEFVIRDSVVRPFAAPGIALLFWDSEVDSDVEVMLNLIGGMSFDFDGIEPFVQLRVLLGDNTMAELMGGVLFRL